MVRAQMRETRQMMENGTLVPRPADVGDEARRAAMESWLQENRPQLAALPTDTTAVARAQLARHVLERDPSANPILVADWVKSIPADEVALRLNDRAVAVPPAPSFSPSTPSQVAELDEWITQQRAVNVPAAEATSVVAGIDPAEVRERLASVPSREAAADYLSGLAAKLGPGELRELAEHLDVPTCRSDTPVEVAGRIVDATAGAGHLVPVETDEYLADIQAGRYLGDVDAGEYLGDTRIGFAPSPAPVSDPGRELLQATYDPYEVLGVAQSNIPAGVDPQAHRVAMGLVAQQQAVRDVLLQPRERTRPSTAPAKTAGKTLRRGR